MFKNTAKSYLSVTALGILAGILVVFFCEVPDNGLWSFYYWSLSTFGFWMFSSSLIVFFSESRRCGAINAGIYIFLMFLITTVYKSLRLYIIGGTPFGSVIELSVSSILGWLMYSVPAGLLCALLGFMLWSGKSDTLLGRTLRVLPEIFMFAETVYLFYNVFMYRTKLFSALSDLVCLVIYKCVRHRRS